MSFSAACARLPRASGSGSGSRSSARSIRATNHFTGHCAHTSSDEADQTCSRSSCVISSSRNGSERALEDAGHAVSDPPHPAPCAPRSSSTPPRTGRRHHLRTVTCACATPSSSPACQLSTSSSSGRDTPHTGHTALPPAHPPAGFPSRDPDVSGPPTLLLRQQPLGRGTRREHAFLQPRKNSAPTRRALSASGSTTAAVPFPAAHRLHLQPPTPSPASASTTARVHTRQSAQPSRARPPTARALASSSSSFPSSTTLPRPAVNSRSSSRAARSIGAARRAAASRCDRAPPDTNAPLPREPRPRRAARPLAPRLRLQPSASSGRSKTPAPAATSAGQRPRPPSVAQRSAPTTPHRSRCSANGTRRSSAYGTLPPRIPPERLRHRARRAVNPAISSALIPPSSSARASPATSPAPRARPRPPAAAPPRRGDARGTGLEQRIAPDRAAPLALQHIIFGVSLSPAIFRGHGPSVSNVPHALRTRFSGSYMPPSRRPPPRQASMASSCRRRRSSKPSTTAGVSPQRRRLAPRRVQCLHRARSGRRLDHRNSFDLLRHLPLLHAPPLPHRTAPAQCLQPRLQPYQRDTLTSSSTTSTPARSRTHLLHNHPPSRVPTTSTTTPFTNPPAPARSPARRTTSPISPADATARAPSTTP